MKIGYVNDSTILPKLDWIESYTPRHSFLPTTAAFSQWPVPL